MIELLASFTYTPVQRWGPVSPHGVGTALGFFLGAFLMARRAEPKGIPRPEIYNAVTWGAFGAIIGARGFYVLGHLSEFTNVRDALAVWEGGLTMFGGFAGGLALGLWYLKRKGFNIPLALDTAAPGFVVGVIVGRIGDIIIGDHLGRATDFFLGYKIPAAPLAPGYVPPTYVPGAVVHHTAVYDLIGAILLLGFLYALERRRHATGTLFATFGIWYGIQRLLVDFTRNREAIESVFAGLSGSQWAGILFAVGGLVALLRIHTREERITAEEPVGAVPAPVASVPAPFEAAPPPPPVPDVPRVEPEVPPQPAPIQPPPGLQHVPPAPPPLVPEAAEESPALEGEPPPVASEVEPDAAPQPTGSEAVSESEPEAPVEPEASAEPDEPPPAPGFPPSAPSS